MLLPVMLPPNNVISMWSSSLRPGRMDVEGEECVEKLEDTTLTVSHRIKRMSRRGGPVLFDVTEVLKFTTAGQKSFRRCGTHSTET